MKQFEEHLQQVRHAARGVPLRYLISYGLFWGEVEGVNLGVFGSEAAVQVPELSVSPVHVPLIIQDPDVDLRTVKRTNNQIKQNC